jgi:hypothetical protein
MDCVRTQRRSHAEMRSNAVQSARVSRGQPWQLSAVDRVLHVRPRIIGAFECRPLSSMSINRSLGHLVECAFLWTIFREQLAPVGLALPILFVTTYYKSLFYALFYLYFALLFNGWLNSSTKVEDDASPLVIFIAFTLNAFIFHHFHFRTRHLISVTKS